MIYRKEKEYDAFRCIADKCPKSCCEGWQIVIDEDSLNKYRRFTGEFKDEIKNGVDFEESAFIQHGPRCHMLSNNGLCALQSALGESYLCDTCRLYPRHIEEFQDLREYSLSLSCPVVAKRILSPDYEFVLTETEDDLTDDPEEFEDFDFMIFDQLEYARDKIFEIASDKSLKLTDRLERIAAIALKLQDCYDRGEILLMGDVFDEDAPETGKTGSYDYCLDNLDLLISLEVLEESWRDSVIEAKNFWIKNTASSLHWTESMNPDAELSLQLENVLKSLLFTYFCGSVYDGEIYARTMICVQSVRNLMLLNHASGKDLTSTLYLYSREVEHSDLNINALISHFEAEL